MQPTLRLPPGSTISDVITTDDLSYNSEAEYPFWSGNYLCSPCKFIYVANTQRGATVRLSWSGTAPLTLWAGDAYEGPAVQVTARPDQTQLTVVVPGDRPVNTVMVGVDAKTDPHQVLNGPIKFKLAVDANQ
jgi:hypothetical protein